MAARIIDGKALAATVRSEVRGGVQAFLAEYGRVPGLDVVLVGEDPASVVYTRNKEKASNEVGMRGRLHKLSGSISEDEIVRAVRSLNADPAVDGILVQLPLPKHIDGRRVLDLIEVAKDVDGFHPVNAGLLALGRPGGLVACTPAGCLRLIETTGRSIDGASAVVVGRSNTVGKPMAQLLLGANATVTVAHSRTRDLPGVCRTADILVAAVGRAQMIRGDWIKPGAVVIDVGQNRMDGPQGAMRMVGDVAYDEAQDVAGFITPVPGGVGPMTIALLLSNTLEAARRRVLTASSPT
jgi:methylenetetrahydrofolate dehydrogenase (NADP+) / methenyltetrahydrofolate cyclohydrolase